MREIKKRTKHVKKRIFKIPTDLYLALVSLVLHKHKGIHRHLNKEFILAVKNHIDGENPKYLKKLSYHELFKTSLALNSNSLNLESQPLGSGKITFCRYSTALETESMTVGK